MTSEQQHGGDVLVAPPPLFPLRLEPTVRAVQYLARSSDSMLGLVTAARGRYGPVQSIYANLPVSDMVAWHRQRQDFPVSSATELYYRAGLLYGVDLIEAVAKETDVSTGFTIAGSEQLDHAVADLMQSYDVVPAEPTSWKLQKARELRYTGGSVLSVINGGLSYIIADKLRQLPLPAQAEASEEKPETQQDNIDPMSLAQSAHVGLVDGVIVGGAYRAQTLGTTLETFDEPRGIYVDNYNPDRHREYPYEYPFRSVGADIVAFEAITDLLSLADIMQNMDAVTQQRKLGIEKSVRGRLVQEDVNSFLVVAEEACIRVRSSPAALLGALAAGIAYDAFQRKTGHEFAHMQQLIPDGAVMGFAWYSLLATLKKSVAKTVARADRLQFERVGMWNTIRGTAAKVL